MDALNVWAADFETTSYYDYLEDGFTRVYLWGIENIATGEYHKGDDIYSFFDFVNDNNCETTYFHNLKFDGKFIIDRLLRDKYIHKPECDGPGTLAAVITDLGEWFNVVVQLPDNRITFRDSLKKFPGMSIESIAQTYHIPTKTYLDVNVRRGPDYKANTSEHTRVQRDVSILAYALNSQYSKGMTHATAASDAYAANAYMMTGTRDYHEQQYKLSKIFPTLSIDSEIRPSYYGGWTWLNPKYKLKTLHNVKVIDKNSMYPSMMYYKPLPYGQPYKRKPRSGEVYIISVDVTFDLKTTGNKFPFVQNRYARNPEMISYSDEPMTLVFVSPTWELFKENYNFKIIKINYIYSFKAKVGLFRPFIDYYYALKKNALTPGDRLMAKLALNSLYGKYGQNPMHKSKLAILNNGVIQYVPGQPQSVKGRYYLAIAAFITGWARKDLIETAEEVEEYIYGDTDSVHFKGKIPDSICIGNDLNQWKLEGIYEKVRYARSKSYIFVKNGVTGVKLAGATEKCKSQINFDNFYPGNEFEGKLTAKTVPGGCVLVPTTFRIKA